LRNADLTKEQITIDWIPCVLLPRLSTYATI